MLFAKDELFIKLLMGIIFIVLPLVGKILEMVMKKKDEAAKAPQMPQRPMVPAPRPNPMAAAPQRDNPLQREMEEFLRQAEQRRQGNAAPPLPQGQGQFAQPRPRTPQPSSPFGGPPQAPTRPQQPQPPKKQKQRPTGSQPAKKPPVQRQGMGAVPLSQRNDDLTNLAEGQTSQLDKHLHQTFDHTLGTLGSTKSGGRAESLPVEALSQVSPELVAALGLSAVGLSDAVRQAFIWNSVLERPEERWE